MRVSLVIPAYNEEKYIGLCLDAVAKNAPGKLFEIIVIDNASSDGTAMVASKYPGVRVVREERKGLTRARERGRLEAKGDLLAYIDADTLITPKWFDTLERQFTKNPNIVCLSGPCVYYDIPKWRRIFVSFFWFILAYPSYIVTGYMVYGGNFTIRKSTIDSMGGFDTSIEFYGEDTNIARRAAKFGKAKFSLTFNVLASGRRLSGQGWSKTAMLYVSNFASEVLRGKPSTSKYSDHR